MVVYFPPEVRSMKYCRLGVWIHVATLPSCQFLYNSVFWVHLYWNYLGSKNKKHLRGSTLTTKLPSAIILTAALLALVSMIAYREVLRPSNCLLCVSYIIMTAYSMLRIDTGDGQMAYQKIALIFLYLMIYSMWLSDSFDENGVFFSNFFFWTSISRLI